MSIDDIKAQAEERMGKALSALHDNFSSVRTGRANASRWTTTGFPLP